MSETKIYNIAVIGCGAIARTGHVPALKVHPRFRLAALCDVDIERARSLAEGVPGVTVTADYRELGDLPEIDAFVLALHPEHSVPIAIDLLERGKPVLDEKPLATSLNDGRRLAACIERTRGVYQLGFVFRFADVIRDLIEPMKSLGTPCLYEVDVYDERLDRNDTVHYAMIQNIFRHSSAPTHEGSHVVDYFRLWNQSPYRAVQARAMKTEPEFEGPNLWACQFDLEDGSTLRMTIGWFLPDLPRSTIRAVGPRGWLAVDVMSGQGPIVRDGTVEPFRSKPFAQNWAAQLDAFARAIDTGELTGATVHDGLRALEATLACERAAKKPDGVEVLLAPSPS